jgi:2-oxoglutarate ferredoxin oxidoreductase subunit gamma
VKPGGLLIVNSAIVAGRTERADIETVYIPANTIAEEMGSIKMLNMATIGVLLGKRPSLLPLETVEQALRNHLPAGKSHLLESNLNVLRRGFDFVPHRLPAMSFTNGAAVHERA